MPQKTSKRKAQGGRGKATRKDSKKKAGGRTPRKNRARVTVEQATYASKRGTSISRFAQRLVGKSDISNVSREASRVLYDLLAPVSVPNFRWPRSGDAGVQAAPTGTVQLPYVTQINASSGYVGTYAQDASTFLIYTFRQLLRAAVILRRTTASFDYNAVWSTGSTTTYTGPTNIAMHPLPIAYLACSSTGAPHGPELFTGSIRNYSEQAFIWVGVGDTITITPSASATFVIDIDRVPNPDSKAAMTEKVTQLAWSSESAAKTYTATTSTFGYMTLLYSSTPGATLSVKLTVAAGDVLCHIPVPNALSHTLWLNDVRMLGASLLMSNTSEKLVKNGTSHAITVQDARPFYTLKGPNTISTEYGNWQYPAEDGIYSWLKPSAGAFDFNCVVETNSTGVVTDTNFALDSGCYYNAHSITVTNTGGLNFMTALHWNLEFNTNDPWAQLDYCDISVETVDKVLQLASRHPSFTHNPIHVKDIVKFVGNTVRALRTHSGLIGKVLRTAFPQYSTLIDGVANLAAI